ncbi:MAG: serine--tRNA ligase [Myxococcota bacterium]|nr:serine--tRNA ligase [Myxococcota bacterium]
MLDPRLIASQPEVVRASLIRRHASEQSLSDLDRLTAMIERRRELQTETDNLRGERNRASKEIGLLFRNGKREEANARREEAGRFGERLDILEGELKMLVEQEAELTLGLPNTIDDRVPDGKGDEENVEIHRWGTPREMDFEAKDHHDVGVSLGIIDFSRAAKLAGSRFSVLRGPAARLERALINLFVDKAVEAGYQELMVPYLVNRESITGTGQLPKFEDDLFRIAGQVNGSDAFLIPTAEVPVTALHQGEILTAEELPLRYAAFTPCFRAEAGSYGRDTRGLIRQHQFHKVELVHLTTAEQSEGEHERLVRHAETLLELLELPYRRMLLCGGDIGFGAQLCYDLEVWLPGQSTYREISSCSNCGDFQARRLKLRYRPEGGGKPKFCHTLNGSGLAVGRTLLAILENYQQADGSVVVPDALRPYMGLDRIAALK